MAKKPVLVVMAAGMGSRYGGLKQIDPVGSQGEATRTLHGCVLLFYAKRGIEHI